MSHLATPAAVWIRPHVEPLLSELVQVIQDAASSGGSEGGLSSVLLEQQAVLRDLSLTLDVAGLRSASVSLALAADVIQSRISPGMELDDPGLGEVVEAVLWAVFHAGNLVESLSLGNMDDPEYSQKLVCEMARVSGNDPVPQWELFAPLMTHQPTDNTSPGQSGFSSGKRSLASEVSWILSRLTVGLASLPSLSTFFPGLSAQLPRLTQEVQLAADNPSDEDDVQERLLSILRRALYGLACALRAMEDKDPAAGLLPSLSSWPAPLLDLIQAYDLSRALPIAGQRAGAVKIMSGMNSSVVQATTAATTEALLSVIEKSQSGDPVPADLASAIVSSLDFMGMVSTARHVARLMTSTHQPGVLEELSELTASLKTASLTALTASPPVFSSNSEQMLIEGAMERLSSVKSEIQSALETISEDEGLPAQLMLAQDQVLARSRDDFKQLGLDIPSDYIEQLRLWLISMSGQEAVPVDNVIPWAQAYACVEYSIDALRAGHRGAPEILFNARGLLASSGFDPQPGQEMKAPQSIVSRPFTADPASSQSEPAEDISIFPSQPPTPESGEQAPFAEQIAGGQTLSKVEQEEPVEEKAQQIDPHVAELAAREDLPPHIRALLEKSIPKDVQPVQNQPGQSQESVQEVGEVMDMDMDIEPVQRPGDVQIPTHEQDIPQTLDLPEPELDLEIQSVEGQAIDPVDFNPLKGALDTPEPEASFQEQVIEDDLTAPPSMPQDADSQSALSPVEGAAGQPPPALPDEIESFEVPELTFDVDQDLVLSGVSDSSEVAQEQTIEHEQGQFSINPTLIVPFDAPATVSIDGDMQEIFSEEIGEELASLSEWVPALFDAVPNPDIVYNIRKSFHTIKGSGRMVGALSLGEMAWAVESVLNKVMDNRRPLSECVVELVLHAQKMVEQYQRALSGKPACWDIPTMVQWASRIENGQEVPSPFPSSIQWEELASELLDQPRSTESHPLSEDEPELLTPGLEQDGADQRQESLPVLELVIPEEDQEDLPSIQWPDYDEGTQTDVVQDEGEILTLPVDPQQSIEIEHIHDGQVEAPWVSPTLPDGEDDSRPSTANVPGQEESEPSAEQPVSNDSPALDISSPQWELSDDVPSLAPTPVAQEISPDLAARISSLSLEPVEGEEVSSEPEFEFPVKEGSEQRKTGQEVRGDRVPEEVEHSTQVPEEKPATVDEAVRTPMPDADASADRPSEVPASSEQDQGRPLKPAPSHPVEPIHPRPLPQDVLLQGTDWKVLLSHVQDQAIAIRSALDEDDQSSARECIDRQIMALDRLGELVLAIERSGNLASARLKSLSARNSIAAPAQAKSAQPATVSPSNTPVVSVVETGKDGGGQGQVSHTGEVRQGPPSSGSHEMAAAPLPKEKPRRGKRGRTQKPSEPVAVIETDKAKESSVWGRIVMFLTKKR